MKKTIAGLVLLISLTTSGVARADPEPSPPPPPPAPPHMTILPPWCFPDPSVCGFKFDPQRGGWYQ
jgi:hypothetical protein